MTGPKVAVVGTLNLDLVVRVDRRPAVGETVIGTSLTERPGGKGANQALAAATAASSWLVGMVGADDAGSTLLAAARAGGVDVDHVGIVNQTGAVNQVGAAGISGRAMIEVDAAGDNRIVVIPGANALLDAAHVEAALDAIDPDAVMTQLESPMAVTGAVAAWCVRRRRRLVLNPSPATALPDEVLAAANPLVVNDIEAAYYARAADTDDVAALVPRLLAMVPAVVITRGSAGVIVATPQRTEVIDVDQVEVSDSTGAGDRFAGVLAAHLAAGADLAGAARIAARDATAFLAARSAQRSD